MRKKIETKILYEKPFIAVCDSNLSNDHLNGLSGMQINAPSGIGHIHNADANEFRTSKTLHNASDDFLFVTESIVKSLNTFLNLNYKIHNTEKVQFTKYEEGDYFKSHLDFHNQNRENRVVERDRVATAILYLNDEYEGGYTIFNNLDLKVKPEKGKILFFEYPVQEDLNINKQTIHEGAVITKGEKVIATQWFLEELDE